jgi:hypothetical protein
MSTHRMGSRLMASLSQRGGRATQRLDIAITIT